MGCGWRDFGDDWIHIDGGDYDHLDYHDITKLEFRNDSVDLIYASHVIEYFDKWEITALLWEWRRVLKPGGILRLAVPDFEVMVDLYKQGYVLDMFIGPLCGRMPMGDQMIYHKMVYDYELLSRLLNNTGFSNIRRWDWREMKKEGYPDDHSRAHIPNDISAIERADFDENEFTLISLNVECTK